jgi:hypothetical protein
MASETTLVPEDKSTEVASKMEGWAKKWDNKSLKGMAA